MDKKTISSDLLEAVDILDGLNCTLTFLSCSIVEMVNIDDDFGNGIAQIQEWIGRDLNRALDKINRVRATI